MVKRVVIRTEQVDTLPDGTTTTTTTYREEESANSGLLEAWGFLILIFATLLAFFFTYRIVSTITQRESTDGIQREQQNQGY